MKTKPHRSGNAAASRSLSIGRRHRLSKATRPQRLGWVCLLLVTWAIAAPAQTFKILASFNYYGGGAGSEYVSLVQGTDGDLYGTVQGGWGEVFKITPSGGLTVLCYFGEDSCFQESRPLSGVIQAANGNFYGTSWQGGATGGVYGPGTVYVTMPGFNSVTLLYSFCSQTNCADGADPVAPLMQAENGNFYGTTFDGGAEGYGTVYEITPAGALTTLHSFRDADGAGPVAGLIQAKNGKFYGTTVYGGAKGGGAVFEITAAGKLVTLYSFCSQKNCTDGANPFAGLVQSKNGNFYGTTYGGGERDHGTVFEITPDGKLTTLYSFCSQAKCTDGALPYAGVILATDGNFYGTTSQGGASNWGTVFAITSTGKLTTLHSFCSKTNCIDGADPVGGLIQATDGNLYGTTAEGGFHENGTVFGLSLGAGPQLETLPASGEEMFALVRRKNLHPLIGLPFLWRQALVDPFAYAPGPAKSNLSCSPAPCVLPPTQASEGGNIVTDPVIATNPANEKELLLGSYDANCSEGSVLGFHLSRDGGSTWQLVDCMPAIILKQREFQAGFDPSLGYDRNGVAYIAGEYGDHGDQGLVAVQKSIDGSHWSTPVVALRDPGKTFPFDTSLTVDTSLSSPWVNSVYVSGVMGLGAGTEQVLVSHSSDGGATWTQAAVDAVQKDPANDRLTRVAIGKDGTVYVTWTHCPATGPDRYCSDGTIYGMFSKSTDGGNTWSVPRSITKAQYAPSALPNTKTGERVYNYPVIAADNSNGPHSGNLYVAMYSWTGTHMGVQVIHSSDGGATWSEPVPVAPPSDTHDQFFPAISVSPTGLVGVSWLDRRNDHGDLTYQAFAAISTDGGKSFGRNWQLTRAFSNPDTNGAYNWMGDYTGNTWKGDNVFVAAWMDSSNGVDMQEEIGGIHLK